MDFGRIKIIILHSWYHMTHNLESLFDLFWYPVIQFIVFGFVALYFNQNQNQVQSQIILLGLYFWEVIALSQYSVAIGALWEMWSKSFNNMFITPLTLNEFVFAEMVSGALKTIVVFLLLTFIGTGIYSFNIFSIGILTVLIAFGELLFFGWAAGMFILGLIFRYGRDIQTLAWALIILIQPISAVFYPLEVLPYLIRQIALILPTTYIFEMLRAKLLTGVIQWHYLPISTLLNIIYFIASYLFLTRMYRRSKEIGDFARMES